MKKCLLSIALIITITLMGCSGSNNGMVGEKPPKAFLKIENETFETVLGTYCWSEGNTGICVDTAGPIELLEDKIPIIVNPGEQITFVMNYEPKPNEFHVVQMNDNKVTEITVEENRFIAPTQSGIYYYSYGVWWMDEKRANTSNADAFYAFALEVK